MPSFLRTGPGRTTCPFVETLVFMVRQSYLKATSAFYLGYRSPLFIHGSPDTFS
jgi:hypothetical protein